MGSIIGRSFVFGQVRNGMARAAPPEGAGIAITTRQVIAGRFSESCGGAKGQPPLAPSRNGKNEGSSRFPATPPSSWKRKQRASGVGPNA